MRNGKASEGVISMPQGKGSAYAGVVHEAREKGMAAVTRPHKAAMFRPLPIAKVESTARLSVAMRTTAMLRLVLRTATMLRAMAMTTMPGRSLSLRVSEEPPHRVQQAQRLQTALPSPMGRGGATTAFRSPSGERKRLMRKATQQLPIRMLYSRSWHKPTTSGN